MCIRDSVHTLRRREEAETLLRVAVQLDGEKTVRETSIPNEQERYDNECERMPVSYTQLAP